MPKRFYLFICTFLAVMTPLSVHATLSVVNTNSDEDILYDDALDIYWTKNANLNEGKMTWQDAVNWINGLNKSGYGGFNDWRLPFTPDGFSEEDGWLYNTNDPDTKYQVVTANELNYLYYLTFGLTEQRYGAVNTQDYLEEHISLFQNFMAGYYWCGPLSEAQLGGQLAAWVFDFAHGSQFLQTANGYAYAIAVRDTSSVPVPEPSSVILFLMGLSVLVRIRSSQNC